MTTPADMQRFDLARTREVTGHGNKRFWSSLEELIDEEGFRSWLAAEFPAASSMFDDPRRRQFLKLMGASLLLAGLAGCGQTKSDQALPYVNQPENLVPGVPVDYATALLFEGYAQPVIATTYSGRPTKLDGNPDHPVTRGKSDAFMQSAIFGLYDPERSKIPVHNGVSASWREFDGALTALRAHWRERKGEGLRILTGATTSPTLIRQMRLLAERYPDMRWHQFEPVGAAHQDEALMAAFERPVTPHYRLDRCEVVVSLDHDLLGPGPHQVMHAGAWAKSRGEIAPREGRSRMHIAEAVPSLTGTVATTRLPCDTSRLGALAQAIGAQFSLAGWTTPDLSESEQRWLDRAMRDLRAHQGHSLFTIGPQMEPQWQALAPFVNQRLNNAGATIRYSEPIQTAANDTQSLEALATDMAAGSVDTLIVLDCNSAYTAPGALRFAEHFARVPTRIHAGLYVDETALLCNWQLPLSHSLETWSDARAVDGSASIIQPVIRPLYASRSIHQLADMLLGTIDPGTGAAVRGTWREQFGAAFDERWARALHDGFVASTAAQSLSVSANIPAAPQPATPATESTLEIVFRPDPTVWDGRFGNIAWQQELPKPLTKITWDNVIAVSPATASAQNLSNGDVVEVTVGGRTVRGPAWIVPGQASNTVALFFGYGRRAGGDIASDSGYDAYAVRPDGRSWSARGTIARVAGQYPLATTQAHHRMEGFDFVREVTPTNPRMPPPKEMQTFYPEWRQRLRPRLGHGDRSRSLHRLQRLRLRVQCREQCTGRRQGPSRTWPRNAVAARGSLLHR